MKKQDLTSYSENELSLLVFNTESWYNKRHSKYLESYLNNNFIFTEDQLNVLLEDIKNEEV